jgi:hypothetical protein
MHRLALSAIPCLFLAAPAVAADLGPYPAEGDTYVLPPPRVERKIVEHHYYSHEAPTVYAERRIYVEPRVYAPPVYTERIYPSYAYAYSGWRPYYFVSRRHFWRPRHRHWW